MLKKRYAVYLYCGDAPGSCRIIKKFWFIRNAERYLKEIGARHYGDGEWYIGSDMYTIGDDI